MNSQMLLCPKTTTGLPFAPARQRPVHELLLVLLLLLECRERVGKGRR